MFYYEPSLAGPIQDYWKNVLIPDTLGQHWSNFVRSFGKIESVTQCPFSTHDISCVRIYRQATQKIPTISCNHCVFYCNGCPKHSRYHFCNHYQLSWKWWCHSARCGEHLIKLIYRIQWPSCPIDCLPLMLEFLQWNLNKSRDRFNLITASLAYSDVVFFQENTTNYLSIHSIS